MPVSVIPEPPGRPLTEVEEAQERVAALAAGNHRDAQALAALGGAMDPSSMLLMRLDTFIGYLFDTLGSATPEQRQMLRLGFEERWELSVHQALDNAKGEVRRAQLAAGATLTPEQMQEMASQQGLLNGKRTPRQTRERPSQFPRRGVLRPVVVSVR